MKKYTIWILTIVMALTFGGLIYVQITYMERMTGMRNEQFTENVKRSLSATSAFLEREETLHYLEEDIQDIEAAFYSDFFTALPSDPDSGGSTTVRLPHTDQKLLPSTPAGVSGQYKRAQDIIRQQ